MTVSCHVRVHPYPLAYVFKIDQKKLLSIHLLQTLPLMTILIRWQTARHHICVAIYVSMGLQLLVLMYFSTIKLHFPLMYEIQQSFFLLYHSHNSTIVYYPIFFFILISPFSFPMTSHLGTSSLLPHLLPIHVLPSPVFQFPAKILG